MQKMQFSQAMATKNLNLVGMEEDDEDVEAGEVIDSAPPMKVGEERQINSLGLKKKLLKSGRGWESPELEDEVTVHYTVVMVDGTKYGSSRDRGDHLTVKLGAEQICKGLDQGITTMKRLETALFSLASNPEKAFEVELISWNRVIGICKDGGVRQRNQKPGDLDEVKGCFSVLSVHAGLVDGSPIARSPEEGIEFHVKGGHFCPAISRAIKTMGRCEKAILTVGPQSQVIPGLDRTFATRKKGGFSTATIKPNYGFGDAEVKRDLAIVPPNSTVIYEIEMVSFSKEKEQWEMDIGTFDVREALEVDPDIREIQSISKTNKCHWKETKEMLSCTETCFRLC